VGNGVSSKVKQRIGDAAKTAEDELVSDDMAK
jgi:hypothetical protein